MRRAHSRPATAVLSLLLLAARPLGAQAAPSAAGPCFDMAAGLPRGLSAATPLPWGKGRLGEVPPVERLARLREQADYWRSTLPPCRTVPRPDRLPATVRAPTPRPGLPASSPLSATLGSAGLPPTGRDGMLPMPGPDEIPGLSLATCLGETPGLLIGRAPLGVRRDARMAIPYGPGADLRRPECLTLPGLRPVGRPLPPNTPFTARTLDSLRRVAQRRPQDLLFSPMAVPPPLIVHGTSPALTGVPPLLSSWDTPCAAAIARYDTWFGTTTPLQALRPTAGSPITRTWMGGWGIVAATRWTLTCQGDRVLRVHAELAAIDQSGVGLTLMGRSVRRWLARVLPHTTTLEAVGGSPDGVHPSVTTYRPLGGRQTPLHPVVRVLLYGRDGALHLVWHRDPHARPL